MKEIESNIALDLLKKDANSTLIDVRTKEEWDNVRADLSSINKSPILVTISNDLDNFRNELENYIPNKENKILFFCRSGSRSKIAADFAKQNGYSKSYNISDGILGWVKNNLPHFSSGEKNA